MIHNESSIYFSEQAQVQRCDMRQSLEGALIGRKGSQDVLTHFIACGTRLLCDAMKILTMSFRCKGFWVTAACVGLMSIFGLYSQFRLMQYLA